MHDTGVCAEPTGDSMRSYLCGLSVAALVASVACGSSTSNPSGGGGSAGAGSASGHSCYAILNEDGGMMGCEMFTYSAGVSDSCSGVTPNSGACPSAGVAGCCVGPPQSIGGTDDTFQTTECFYGGASVATMAKKLCTNSWQTSVP
jgi:hypothetical protein